MGCDIHVHVEIKVNDEWLHYNQPRTSRFYALFAKMAGVRNYDDAETPISPPKGLPSDATKTTLYDYTERWAGDAHSESWLAIDEITQLEEWWKEHREEISLHRGSYFEDYFGYLFGNPFSGLRRYPAEAPKGLTDARFVFWFDN